MPFSRYNDGKSLVSTKLGKTVFEHLGGNAFVKSNVAGDRKIPLSPISSDTKNTDEELVIMKPANIFIQKIDNDKKPIANSKASANIHIELKNKENLFSNIEKNRIVVNGEKTKYDELIKYINVPLVSKKVEIDNVNTNAAINKTGKESYVYHNNKELQKLATNFKSKKVYIEQPMKDIYKNKEARTFIAKTPEKYSRDLGSVEPISMSVEDYMPPNWNRNGSDGVMRSFKYVIQKDSYVEMDLNFEGSRVINAIGLPNGMRVNDSTIIGSPKMYGIYVVTLELNNGNKIQGNIEVPILERKR